jgi:hypothetical protein
MAYNLATLSTLVQHVPSKLKGDFTSILKLMDEGAYYGDDAPVTKSKKYTVKVTPSNFYKICGLLIKKYDATIKQGAKKSADVVIQEFKIRFIETGKKSVGSLDATVVQKQELASLWIIQRSLKDKKKYTCPEDISRDVKYKELVAIYPDVMEDGWLDNFYQQQKKMLEVFSGVNFTEYNRDGGFMTYISNLIRDKFKISKKDSWNPADIWLISNETSVRKTIDQAMSGKSVSISKLNDVMKILYAKNKLAGVSLKKVSGNVARFEEVNTKNALMKDAKFVMKLDKSVMNMKTKSDKTLSSSDMRIDIKSANDVCEFQIRQNGKGFQQNLKFDGKFKGAGAARVGKVPLELLTKLLAEYGVGNNASKFFVNKHQMYPKSLKAFDLVKEVYQTRFNFVNTKTETGIKNSDFTPNMIRSFNSADLKNGVSHTKLMELDFLYCIYKIPEAKRNKMLTDMVYLAEKRGSQFGPFGKLY